MIGCYGIFLSVHSIHHWKLLIFLYHECSWQKKLKTKRLNLNTPGDRESVLVNGLYVCVCCSVTDISICFKFSKILLIEFLTLFAFVTFKILQRGEENIFCNVYDIHFKIAKEFYTWHVWVSLGDMVVVLNDITIWYFKIIFSSGMWNNCSICQ